MILFYKVTSHSPVTIVMKSVERPEGRQSTHANTVTKEYLRGSFYPCVRVHQTIPSRGDQISDTVNSAFQRYRPN